LNRWISSTNTRLLGGGHHVFDLFNAGHYRAERDESRARRFRNEPRKRCLARARRTPQNDRAQTVVLDRFTQWLAWRENVLLSNEFVEGGRPHALRERSAGSDCCGIGRRIFE
jgi:hypothetical protein